MSSEHVFRLLVHLMVLVGRKLSGVVVSLCLERDQFFLLMEGRNNRSVIRRTNSRKEINDALNSY